MAPAADPIRSAVAEPQAPTCCSSRAPCPVLLPAAGPVGSAAAQPYTPHRTGWPCWKELSCLVALGSACCMQADGWLTLCLACNGQLGVYRSHTHTCSCGCGFWASPTRQPRHLVPCRRHDAEPSSGCADFHRVLREDTAARVRDAVHLLHQQPQERSGPLRGLCGAPVAGPPTLHGAVDHGDMIQHSVRGLWYLPLVIR